MRRLISLFPLTAGVGLVIMSTVFVLAHEGEDHSIQLPAPAKVGRFVVATATETFEVVLKHDVITPGEPATLDLFLNDFATNRPTKDAEIEVEVQDSLPVETTVESAGIPGFYHLKAKFPEAKSYDLLLTIMAGEVFDLVVVSGIEVGKEIAITKSGAESRNLNWQWGIMAVGTALIGFVSFSFGKRRGIQINNQTKQIEN